MASMTLTETETTITFSDPMNEASYGASTKRWPSKIGIAEYQDTFTACVDHAWLNEHYPRWRATLYANEVAENAARLRPDLRDAREQMLYEDGYEDGYREGKDDGYEEGWESGRQHEFEQRAEAIADAEKAGRTWGYQKAKGEFNHQLGLVRKAWKNTYEHVRRRVRKEEQVKAQRPMIAPMQEAVKNNDAVNPRRHRRPVG